MGNLRSAIDELRAEDLDGLGDEALEARYGELHRSCQALDAERLRTLGEVDRRASVARDGYLSTQAWLADKFKVSFPMASGEVRLAGTLEEMGPTREAFGDGEVSASALRVLAGARRAHPEAFSEAEDLLVEAARTLAPRELDRAVASWSRGVDEARAKEADQVRWERRRLSVSRTLAGMVKVEGELDLETGETFLTAIGAVVDAGMKAGDATDVRTPEQRRADALGELSRSFLDRSDRPAVGGERPHVSLVVDLDTLRGRAGEPGEAAVCDLEHTGPVLPEIARLLACDASVSRIVLAGASEPLDVGRKTSVVPGGMRRAAVVRDRGCRFPWCDRPPGWCDVHHARHWADGGPTSLANCLLLCRRHHRLIHVGGFRLEMGPDGPRFFRPDGTLLEDRGPP